MTQTYDTPQEAEDAYYDALEEGRIDKLTAVWADSDDIFCLLPMYPMIQGREGVRDIYAHLLSQTRGIALSITHLKWIETADIAIHQVEEVIQNPQPDETAPAPVYATNIFRRDTNGWRMIIHQNAPAPPPPPPELVLPE